MLIIITSQPKRKIDFLPCFFSFHYSEREGGGSSGDEENRKRGTGGTGKKGGRGREMQNVIFLSFSDRIVLKHEAKMLFEVQ